MCGVIIFIRKSVSRLFCTIFIGITRCRSNNRRGGHFSLVLQFCFIFRLILFLSWGVKECVVCCHWHRCHSTFWIVASRSRNYLRWSICFYNIIITIVLFLLRWLFMLLVLFLCMWWCDDDWCRGWCTWRSYLRIVLLKCHRRIICFLIYHAINLYRLAELRRCGWVDKAPEERIFVFSNRFQLDYRTMNITCGLSNLLIGLIASLFCLREDATVFTFQCTS